MDQVRDEVWMNDRSTATLFGSFAAGALLLATLGIYSLMAFSVTRRSQEIALRMAVGATCNQVIALIVKEGVELACIGLSFGLIGAYFVGRAMQSTLFNVSAIDLSAFGAMGLLLLLAALLASYLPALQAASIETMQTLRRD